MAALDAPPPPTRPKSAYTSSHSRQCRNKVTYDTQRTNVLESDMWRPYWHHVSDSNIIITLGLSFMLGRGVLLSAHPHRPERGVIWYRWVSVITATLGATIACKQSDGEYDVATSTSYLTFVFQEK